MISNLVIAVIISLLVGFYSGRYLERQTFKKNIETRSSDSQSIDEKSSSKDMLQDKLTRPEGMPRPK